MDRIWSMVSHALRVIGIRRDPFRRAVIQARAMLARVAGSGIAVPDEISGPILRAGEALEKGTVPPELEQAFYGAWVRLNRLAHRDRTGDDVEQGNPLKDALEDAELLLKYGAETGIEIAPAVIAPILKAQDAFQAEQMSETIRAEFYAAYGRLSKLFGDVTADTIRYCSAPETRRILNRDRLLAVLITVVIATFSVVIFVADSMSKGILEDISSANRAAAALRVSLTPTPQASSLEPIYAQWNPCELLEKPPPDSARILQGTADIEQFQTFTATIHDLLGKGIKLNWFVGKWESDPFAADGIFAGASEPQLRRQLRVNPAILNFPAEVLCKIRTYQDVRTFASNVQADYAAVVGALASYALPIVYALLGAYAYRLRIFSETIRKRTYHPSFSDSARMITAIIAGAIAGLFNPARSLSLSPLATAFLVGYGVELFFRFLDTLINAFGSPPVGRRRPA